MLLSPLQFFSWNKFTLYTWQFNKHTLSHPLVAFQGILHSWKVSCLLSGPRPGCICCQKICTTEKLLEWFSSLFTLVLHLICVEGNVRGEDDMVKLWQLAQKRVITETTLGLVVENIPGDWRTLFQCRKSCIFDNLTVPPSCHCRITWWFTWLCCWNLSGDSLSYYTAFIDNNKE